jgi:hypothetical protein
VSRKWNLIAGVALDCLAGSLQASEAAVFRKRPANTSCTSSEHIGIAFVHEFPHTCDEQRAEFVEAVIG